MTAPTGIGYQKSFRFWLEFNRLFVEFFRLAVGLHFTARSTSEMRTTVRLLLYLSSMVPLVTQAQARAPVGRKFQIPISKLQRNAKSQ
jgi:hypothetical protein